MRNYFVKNHEGDNPPPNFTQGGGGIYCQPPNPLKPPLLGFTY